MINPDVNFKKPSQQNINALLELYQTGRYVEAEKLSLTITKEFPKHQFAWKVLALTLKETGKINESLITIKKSIQLEPNDSNAHYNLGVILQILRRLDEAEVSFRQTIKLKPDYIEALNNLGIILKEHRKLDEAENNFRKIIELKPSFAEAHNNLGVTMKELGRIEESEPCYRKAIRLNPNYAEAYINLGITLEHLGRLEEAMYIYSKTIDLNLHLPKLSESIAGLLTSYVPHKKFFNPIVMVNEEIKKNYLKEKTIGVIMDEKIIKLFNQSTNIIKKSSLKIETQLSQIFRRNSINLNCDRHMAIFNKFKIIPKFCFGCYKVQIEPRNILELIKLLIVFDQIKLVKNNSRKCMVEMRPEVSGFYKGLIYCSSLDEAYKVANYLQILVQENIGSKIHVFVKRGCSEYPIAFPDYKKINRTGDQPMKYNKNWQSIEEDYDLLNSIKSSRIITPTVTGLNLQDVLIIRNWIDYAKGIEDPSVHLLKQNMIFSQKIYRKAKIKLKNYTDSK